MRIASRTLLLFATAATAAASFPARAGAPLIVDSVSGKPWRYPPGVAVPVYHDLGDYAVVTDWANYPAQVTFGNAVGAAQVTTGLASWASVPTAAFRAVLQGDFSLIGLPDITGANADLVIGAWNGGGIDVVFDADGSIFQDFFGVGPSVLGISSPEFGDDSTGFITESWTVLNGQAIDASDVEAAHYQGIATHELGHAIGLAHTQTNGAAYFYGPWTGEPVGPQSCAALPYRTDLTAADVETMYPFSDPSPTSDVGLGQANVHTTDDVAAVSDLYPGPGWPRAYGTISGKVLGLDGRTQLTGVNVIVRNLDDPFADANSSLSGQWTQGQFGPDGSFTLNGLRPGARYVVYLDAVVAGGFPTPPLWFLPGSERFYDGPRRGDDGWPFDPCAYQVITARAGSPVRADIAFERRKGAPVVLALDYGAGATGISGDGKTVVGNYGRGGPAFRWTEKAGIVSLGVNTPGTITSISGNGRYISTNILSDDDTDLGVFRWDVRNGWLPVDRVGSCGTDTTDNSGVANDGTVFGLAYNTCLDYVGFQWNPRRGGTRLLPSTGQKADGTPINGRPTLASADGSVLAGWEENDWGGRVPVVWLQGKPSRITQADGSDLDEATGLSSDGQVVSGATYWGLPNEGLGWRKRVDRPEVRYYSSYSSDAAPPHAYALSRDGSVMAGFAGDPWFSVSPGPFLWTREMGAVSLDAFLRQQGTAMDQYLSLWTPMAMSDDGTVLAGWGMGFQYWAGWVLQIPKAFVCHLGKGERGIGHTVSAAFPAEFDEHLRHGDAVGPCPDHRD
ncbi:MAG TPA: hypothetical protein VMT17_07890 [Anaeromyxobacteraceae bacterium]|nr:hypothetical protein [Anaeromyxobacteraceae bacterium]